MQCSRLSLITTETRQQQLYCLCNTSILFLQSLSKTSSDIDSSSLPASCFKTSLSIWQPIFVICQSAWCIGEYGKYLIHSVTAANSNLPENYQITSSAFFASRIHCLQEFTKPYNVLSFLTFCQWNFLFFIPLAKNSMKYNGKLETIIKLRFHHYCWSSRQVSFPYFAGDPHLSSHI